MNTIFLLLNAQHRLQLARYKMAQSGSDSSNELESEEEPQTPPQISSLETSRLAAQVDSTILPDIYFVPSSAAAPRSHNRSSKCNVYWFLFDKIAEYQSSSDNRLPSTLLQKFRSLTLDEQLLNFELSHQLSKDQIRIRWQFAVDILFILRQKTEYKNCDAYVFGSLLTGLADTHSDIDISFDIDGDNYKSLERKSPVERKYSIFDIRSKVAKILGEAFNPHDSTLPLCSKLELRDKRNRFIRMRYAETRIKMDITFCDRLSLHDGKLVQFYVNFDPRAKQLIIFLRYWVKFHRISGPGKIRPHAVAILCLVFLMEIGILPSVLLLQAIEHAERWGHGDTSISDLIEDWDSSFCDDQDDISVHFQPSVPPETTNEAYTTSFLQLLSDFFERMATTRFETCLVSPLLGKIVERENLFETASAYIDALTVPVTEFWKESKIFYFQYNSSKVETSDSRLFIHDLFVVEVNVAGTVPQEICQKFVNLARSTLSILKNNPTSLLDLFSSSTTATTVPLPNPTVQILPTTSSGAGINGNKIFWGNIIDEILNATGDITVPETSGNFNGAKPFDAIRLKLCWSFVHKCLKNLCGYNMLGSSDEVDIFQLKWQIIALWRMFAISFLENIFEYGLMLVEEKEGTKYAAGDCPLGTIGIWKGDDNRLQENIKKFRRSSHPHENNPSEAQLQALKAKSENDLVPRTDKIYKVHKFKVTYPFWERGRNISKTNKCPMKEEHKVSLRILKKYAENSDDDYDKVPGGPASMTCNFTPFFLNVLIRLDVRADTERELCGFPTIAFAMQTAGDGSPSSQESPPQEHVWTTVCVRDALERIFPVYQIYQLSKWFGRIETDDENSN